jgi:hypothetical protein
MKKIIFALLTLSLFSFVLAAPWVTFKADDKVSVMFPQEPQKYDAENIDLMVLTQSDNCLFMFLKLGEQNIDVSLVKEYYKGYVEGFLEDSKRKLEYKKAIKIGKYEGLELKYTEPADDGSISTKYHRAVLANGSLYCFQCDFMSANSKNCEKEKNTFFKSIKVK